MLVELFKDRFRAGDTSYKIVTISKGYLLNIDENITIKVDDPKQVAKAEEVALKDRTRPTNNWKWDHNNKIVTKRSVLKGAKKEFSGWLMKESMKSII